MPQVIPLVVTAITTVTSAVIAAGPIAVAAFNAINVIGAAALANEAFKALQPEVRQSGASIEWEANPNAALPFAFGRVGVSGNIVANRVYGPDDMYVGFVSVVSAAGPIKSFVSFKADDTPVSFDASGKAVTSYHANVMWRRTQLGQQPEPSALSSPSGLKNGVTMPGWGASYKLSGKAAYIWTLSENSKRSAYEGRVPTPLNVIEGLYCWDPRLDSTYPGGSGTCRLNDPSTWVWRENPALFALKWALGLWEGPVGKGAPQMGFQVGGIGAKVENIRVDRFVELANIADANGWKAAAWPKADEPKDQVLDSFLQAAGAVYADEQGKISCIQRAAARPSILTITSDDIAGTVEYDTTTSKIGRLNTIRPRYWSEANDWQMAPTNEVSATLWREEDGQGQAVTRSKGIDFNYVPGSKQARELACLLVAHTREGIRGTVPVRSYVDVEPGDAFDFQVPEATLNGLKCLVLNTEPDLENDTVLITFASESDGKYAYAYGQVDAPPPAPVLEPSDPTYVTPPGPGDWTVTVPGPAPDGTQFPTIDLTGFVDSDTAEAMLILWRAVAEGEDPEVAPDFTDDDGNIIPGWVDAGVWPPTTRQLSITGMPPGSVVWIAIRYKKGNNYSAPELAGPITVQTLIANPNDGSADTTPPDVPTGLVLSSTSTINSATGQPFIKIIATWNAVTATDLDHYDVEITEGGFSITEWAGPDAAPRYERGALTGRVYSIRVRAVDKAGNASDWTASADVTGAGDNIPPAAPTGFTATATLVGANLSWTNASADDLNRVEIWEHTSNASGSATRIAIVNAVPSAQGSWPRTGLSAGQTRYYWLKSVDTSGNASGFSSAQSITVPTVPAPPVDTTPPTVPTGLSLSSGVVIDSGTGQPRQRITATWTANSDTDLGGYEVEVTEASGSPLIRTAGTNRDQWDSRPGIVYSVRIRAVDTSGNRSAWTSAQTATGAGDGTAPGAPSALSAGASLGSIFLRGTAPSDSDLSKIEIWENTSNTTTGAAKVGEVNAAPGGSWAFTRSGLAAQTTRYYWAKAVDTSGNVSGFSAGTDATTTSVTNADVQVGTLYGDRLVAGSVEGDRFSTTTSLPGTITVGTTGVTIETTTTRAADPAARINTQTTLIDPGRILVSGSTTLGDWRYGPDLTKIDGGTLAANTVQANSMVIGVRGLQSCSCQFEANPDTNVVSWTAGQIIYADNAGVAQVRSISAGSATWSSGTLYVYWTLGGTTLATSTDWYTANASNALTLAAYRGGRSLDQNYGRTVIDGFNIRTASIDTDQLNAGSVDTAQLRALSITGDKVQANTLEGTVFKTNTSLPGTIALGATGVTITDAATWASNPASRVNANSTLIQPGKILLTGSSTLTSLLYGADQTLIDGGKIAANTIAANTAVIGMRGVTWAGPDFQTTGNTLSWGSGVANYINDSGSPAQQGTSEGSVTWTGSNIYVYWQVGSSSLSTTTSLATAMASNRILMCDYRGGTNYTSTYGRTVINANNIQTGAITASKIDVGTLSAISADLGNITAGNINMVSGTRRVRLSPGFGSGSNIILWAGPTSVASGSETTLNGTLVLTADGSGDFFGGKTLSAPFDSGAGSTVTVPSTSYVDAAVSGTIRTVNASQILTYLTGTVRMQAPADPENGASAAWRVVHTNTSGGDVVVMRSGTFLASATGSVVSQSVEALITQVTPNWWASVAASRTGDRVVRFQLARSGPTTFLDIQTPRLRGFYAT